METSHAAGRPGLLELVVERLADLAELGPQGLELLVQHRADRLADDVFHDRVGRVVGPRRLALGLVVGEIDVALLDDHLGGLAPLGLGLGERDVLLPVLLGLGRQVFLRDLELEFQQPFVDRPQVTDFERLVVDEDEAKRLLVLVPGEAVDGPGEVSIGDFMVTQEPCDPLVTVLRGSGVVLNRPPL